MCTVKAGHPAWLGVQDQDVLNEPMNQQQQQIIGTWLKEGAIFRGYIQTQNPCWLSSSQCTAFIEISLKMMKHDICEPSYIIDGTSTAVICITISNTPSSVH